MTPAYGGEEPLLLTVEQIEVALAGDRAFWCDRARRENMLGPEPWASCHLCGRGTAHCGRFDRFDATALPMCWQCAVKARAGERRFWWR